MGQIPQNKLSSCHWKYGNLDGAKRQALFSDCGKYRYSLQVNWDGRKRKCLLVMLNPSEANELANDPTIKRSIDFAKKWSCGSLEVVNLFAFRSPHPKVLMAADDPVGPLNDVYIEECLNRYKRVLVAWGNHGSFLNKAAEFRTILKEKGINPFALKLNASGEPAHPLYLKKQLKPFQFKL